MVLIAGATAVASALLMVAVAIVKLPSQPTEDLFNLVGEPGLRPGTVSGAVLLVMPLLLLLYQAVRLGTASRERRLAALRVAGATPRQVRRLGTLEVGVPVIAGAVAGLGVYGLLRVTLGGTPFSEIEEFAGSGPALVPSTVAPSWWQFLAITGAITALGVFVGLRASRRVIVTPLGVTRVQAPKPPRPWGLLLGGAAVGMGAIGIAAPLPRGAYTPLGIAVVLSVLVGAVMLAPWFAYRIGRRLSRRTGSPVTLLAARQLVVEPRPAGRAAAAVGAIGLVAGGAGGLATDVLAAGESDSFYVTSLALVGAALLVALAITTSSLAVHAVESLLDRRRALAALVAAGTEPSVLYAAQRRAAVIVAVPLAATGAVLGALVVGLTGMNPITGFVASVPAIAVVVLLTWVATHAAAGIVKPWMLKATAPANLRTE
jgi:hypothetical protein